MHEYIFHLYTLCEIRRYIKDTFNPFYMISNKPFAMLNLLRKFLLETNLLELNCMFRDNFYFDTFFRNI